MLLCFSFHAELFQIGFSKDSGWWPGEHIILLTEIVTRDSVTA
jgi:hypothetical protein